MIAPLRFGQPTSDFEGGEVAMEVGLYDLDAVEYKEEETIEGKKEEGLPLFLIIPALIFLGLVLFFLIRKRGIMVKQRI
jgi:hypothetical protein